MFVRLFLALGSITGASVSAAGWGGTLSVAPAVAEAFAAWSDESFMLTDLRLRVPAGEDGSAAGAKDSCGAVVTGCNLGSSADETGGAVCRVLATMGEGFRLRLDAGEVLWAAARTPSASPKRR